MKHKKYRILYLPLFIAAAALICQTGALLKEQKGEHRTYLISASLIPEEITQKQQQTMATFPGLKAIWTVLTAEVTVQVEAYTETTLLQGVDLESYPLTVKMGVGEKRKGQTPLLVLGEDFFGQLQDQYENPITRRQKEILTEKAGMVKVRIRPSEQDTESEAVQKETEGEFLGIVKQDGLYMDQEQMKQWLASQGSRPQIGKICMKIQGKRNLEAAKRSLEQAGFLVEEQ